MASILSLADARAALRLPATDTSNDADLTATYIPAVTLLVEDITGPVVAQSGLTRTFDGGRTSVLIPHAITAVASVTETGTTLVPNVDYTVNLLSGIVTRGSVQQPYIFLPGQQNIVVTYSAGDAANTGAVPANIKLAARIILARLWQDEQQGFRPAFNTPSPDQVQSPSGWLVPRDAFLLLKQRPGMPGFA